MYSNLGLDVKWIAAVADAWRIWVWVCVMQHDTIRTAPEMWNCSWVWRRRGHFSRAAWERCVQQSWGTRLAWTSWTKRTAKINAAAHAVRLNTDCSLPFLVWTLVVVVVFLYECAIVWLNSDISEISDVCFCFFFCFFFFFLIDLFV